MGRSWVLPLAGFAFLLAGVVLGWKLFVEGPGVTAGAFSMLLVCVGLAALPLLLIAGLRHRPTQEPPSLDELRQAVERNADLEEEGWTAREDDAGALARALLEDRAARRRQLASLRAEWSELAAANDLNETLLETLRPGILFLDSAGCVRPRSSRSLADLLGRDDLAGESFPDLVRALAPLHTHQLSQRFLTLLFDPARKDAVIAKINPLREVEIAPSSVEERAGEARVLSFAFDRIWREGRIEEAMVTVEDVSANVRRARQLEESEARMKRQAELLNSVLRIEPRRLRRFIEDAHEELEEVSSRLEEAREPRDRAAEDRDTDPDLLRPAIRRLRRLKETASNLRVHHFEERAARLEEQLRRLQGHRSVAEAALLPLVLEVGRLRAEISQIREALVEAAEEAVEGETGEDLVDEPLTEAIRRRIELRAEQHGKDVFVHTQSTDVSELPTELRAALLDVLPHLADNSLIHGIESVDDRLALGKPEMGTLLVGLRRRDERLEVLYRDDGRGFDYPTLIEAVKELLEEEPELFDRLVDRDSHQWRVEELNGLLFREGLALPAPDGEIRSGRGLARARRRLAEVGGEISLRQSPGTFCEILIRLPLAWRQASG